MKHTKDFLRQHAVYQIYPISFCDGNNDGYGDLKGLLSKLDYLDEIGIKILWLSPIYASPMVDFGYDISDYRNINPLFGTMEDFDTLIKECEKRGMKIIMDLVVNHTSDQHEWFKQALKNKNSPYRDYYYFKEGKKDEKGNFTYPNNWTSNFLGSAWEEVENEPGMYYLHIFTKQQPDLNWHNPKVLQEVENIIRFWMNKGVYGFRCDVISEIYKESFEDGTTKVPVSQAIGMEHYLATEGNHEILKKIQKDVISPMGGVLIGECGGNITIRDGQRFLEDELDTFFEFDIANCYKNLFSKKIDAKKFKKILISWIKAIDWSGNYIENHDLRRVFSRYVYGKYENLGAKMLLVLQFTLRGTPFIYMGQEYGAHNYPTPLKLKDCKDIVTHNVYNLAKSLHVPSFIAEIMAHKYGRDDERAPMAFSREAGYGFSSKKVTPWQPYNPYNDEYNAVSQSQDENGILSFFKKINNLRETDETLIYGTINFDDEDAKLKDVLVYSRHYHNENRLIILNLSNKKRRLPKCLKKIPIKECLLSNYDDRTDFLRPYEAFVIKY